MAELVRKKFGERWNLEVVIGGQMGFDIFPKGWDKTFTLKYLSHFENIYFFGDKTEPVCVVVVFFELFFYVSYHMNII
jgi:phosphomannomutase